VYHFKAILLIEVSFLVGLSVF